MVSSPPASRTRAATEAAAPASSQCSTRTRVPHRGDHRAATSPTASTPGAEYCGYSGSTSTRAQPRDCSSRTAAAIPRGAGGTARAGLTQALPVPAPAASRPVCTASGEPSSIQTSAYFFATRDERSGRIMNPTLADYHVPSHLDIPEIEVMWTDIPDPRAPLGARGIGEIGITGVGAAIANAVFNATGKRIRDLPITLDKVL